MSFIYSRALVEEYSPANCLGIERFAQSSGSPSPNPCLWHDKMTEPSRHSQFGMTCKPLTEDHGAALLTSFVAGFRVKTSVQQGGGQELMESEAGCGAIWPASLVKFDHALSLWKTAQFSLLGGLDEFLETWPRWGLMRNGECWELPTLAPRINGSASGLWQTPVADDSVNRVKGKINSRGEPKLSAQVMKWPTPVATAYKGWSPNHNRADTDDRLDYTVEREAFILGQQTPLMRLNPEWVEWLMGWPIGHTALKPLETGRYQEWLQQHLSY